MRRSVLAIALAIAVTGGGGAARADVGALTGVGHVTLVSDCPNGLKVPIEGATTNGSRWSFTIAAAHLGCVVSWGNPITFEGPWDPVAPACNAQNGHGCPTSTDPARPGFFALGAVVEPATLTVTSLRFCVATRCFSGVAFVERT